MKKYIAVLFIMLLVIAGCSGNNNVNLAKNYQTVYNTHDADAVMALMAEDAVIKTDRKILDTPESIRNMVLYDSSIGTLVEYGEMQALGDSVVFDIVKTSEWLELAGIDAYHYKKCVMTFENGLVKKIEAESAEQTLIQLSKVLQSIAQWMPDSLAIEINDVIQSGYSADTGERWKKILRQWRDEIQG